MITVEQKRREVRKRLIEENEFPNVPENWGVERLRFLFSESKDRNGKIPVGEMLSVSEYNGVVPREYEHEEQKRTEEELENYRVVRPGQLAVNSMWLNHLGLGVSDHTGHVSPAYNVYDISCRLDQRFVHHLMRSNYYLKIYLRYLYGIRPNSFQIKSNDWASIPIIVPERPNQRAIADFLDRETGRIDSLLEKKQRLVELLGEQLQAKISTLVKGRSSEDTVRLRHVVKLNPSARHLCLEPDTPVTFCPMEAIHDGVGGIDTSNTRPLSEVVSASYNFFGEGDILLAKVTPCFENGKKALAKNLKNGVGFATSEVFVVRPDPQRTYPEYLVYLFSSADFQYAGRSSMTGAGGLRRISERSILEFPLLVGDRWEQKKIVEEIDAEVAISRRISGKTNVSIERLKEYRSALVTSAVTGQIDVSTYARSGTTDRQLDVIQSEMQA